MIQVYYIIYYTYSIYFICLLMFSTGMFNGLKKMVGKGADDACNINHQQLCTHAEQNMPLPKFNKKRKVTERMDAPSLKKKYITNCCTTIVLCELIFFFFIHYFDVWFK